MTSEATTKAMSFAEKLGPKMDHISGLLETGVLTENSSVQNAIFLLEPHIVRLLDALILVSLRYPNEHTPMLAAKIGATSMLARRKFRRRVDA